MDKKVIDGKEVKKWQERMGYTYESASTALGIGRTTFARHLTSGADRTVALAMVALEAGLEINALQTDSTAERT